MTIPTSVMFGQASSLPEESCQPEIPALRFGSTGVGLEAQVRKRDEQDDQQDLFRHRSFHEERKKNQGEKED